MSSQRTAIVGSFLLLQGAAANILSLVNPLIGTSNGGHVFPGATLPFGMAKAGADVNVENQGMYRDKICMLLLIRLCRRVLHWGQHWQHHGLLSHA